MAGVKKPDDFITKSSPVKKGWTDSAPYGNRACILKHGGLLGAEAGKI
jgi:hypothetical protein